MSRARNDSSYGEEGVAGLLIIVGVVLLFFPEPSTSLFGVLLILIGALVWLADWLM